LGQILSLPIVPRATSLTPGARPGGNPSSYGSQAGEISVCHLQSRSWVCLFRNAPPGPF